MPMVYIHRRVFYVAVGILVNHFSLVGHHVIPTARLLCPTPSNSFEIPRALRSPLMKETREGPVAPIHAVIRTSAVERNSSTMLVND